jgi:hypothetical protein
MVPQTRREAHARFSPETGVAAVWPPIGMGGTLYRRNRPVHEGPGRLESGPDARFRVGELFWSVQAKNFRGCLSQGPNRFRPVTGMASTSEGTPRAARAPADGLCVAGGHRIFKPDTALWRPREAHPGNCPDNRWGAARKGSGRNPGAVRVSPPGGRGQRIEGIGPAGSDRLSHSSGALVSPHVSGEPPRWPRAQRQSGWFRRAREPPGLWGRGDFHRAFSA